LPTLKDAGVQATEARPLSTGRSGRAVWPLALGAGVGIVMLGGSVLTGRRRRAASVSA
jgi:hypothetical protein